jgi:hypothetical protein
VIVSVPVDTRQLLCFVDLGGFGGCIVRTLSFAKTAADSLGDAPWATGGLSTPDDR